MTIPGATKQIAEDYGRLGQNEWPEKGGFKYLAGKLLEACELLLPGPESAMKYIRDLTEHCMGQGRFLEW